MVSLGVSTKLTEMLGTKSPIVLPAMAFGSGGALAAEVSKTGGFGFIGLAFESPQYLKDELDTARKVLNLTAASTPAVLPVGAGLIGWIIDSAPENAKELISVMFEERVQAIWLSFGIRKEWTEYIRAKEVQTGHPVNVFVQTHSVAEAEQAINELHADVVVVQGIEAGGHGAGTYGLGIMTLLPQVLLAVQKYRNPPPILAAGGIVTGAQVSAMLAIGAAGAVIGTRFLVTPESRYSESQKRAIINAESIDAVRTWAFDAAGGTTGWPKGIDGRALMNATYRDYESNVDLEEIQRKYKIAFAAGDADRVAVWAGTGVGLIKTEKSAKDVLAEIHDETLECLKQAERLVNVQ